jgi:hypothetical protein
LEANGFVLAIIWDGEFVAKSEEFKSIERVAAT